jgi:hypothetical protein
VDAEVAATAQGAAGRKPAVRTLATRTRRCGARQRKQVTLAESSPCGETPGDLLGDGGAAIERFHSGGATRVSGGGAEL